MRRARIIFSLAVLGIAAGASESRQSSTRPTSRPESQPQARVLVFSKTAGFRHEAIPSGIEAVKRLGDKNGFTVHATEDSNAFSIANLTQFDAVVFLNTTGDVLDDAQQAAFEAYIRAGGGFVGVHSASDTEYEWPWYGRLVGAYFADHPAVQQADIDVLDRSHPSTRHLPARWQRTDEWYNFRASPIDGVTILATLDESSYTGGTMKGHHPIVWCHEFEGGRAWYTACGHTVESYAEDAFLAHLLGGVEWAMNRGRGSAPRRDGRVVRRVSRPPA